LPQCDFTDERFSGFRAGIVLRSERPPRSIFRPVRLDGAVEPGGRPILAREPVGWVVLGA
jgi:hypothetical protein